MSQSPTFTVRRYGRCFEAVRVSEADGGLAGTSTLTQSRAVVHQKLDEFLDRVSVDTLLEFGIPRTRPEDRANG